MTASLVSEIIQQIREDPDSALATIERELAIAQYRGKDCSEDEAWQTILNETLDDLVLEPIRFDWFPETRPVDQQLYCAKKTAQLKILRYVLNRRSAVYNTVQVLQVVSVYGGNRYPWSCCESVRILKDILELVNPSKEDIFKLMEILVPMLKEFSKSNLPSSKMSPTAHKKGILLSELFKTETPLVRTPFIDFKDEVRTKYMGKIGTLSFIVNRLDSADLDNWWHFILPFLLHFLEDHDMFVKCAAIDVLRSILHTPSEKPSIVIRSGVAPMLMDAMVPCLLALPSLTPAKKSVLILPESYAAYIELLKLANPDEEQFRIKLAALLTDYVLPALSKASEFPEISNILLVLVSNVILPYLDTFVPIVAKPVIYTILNLLQNPYTAFSLDTVSKSLQVLEIVKQNSKSVHACRYDVLGSLLKLLQRMVKYNMQASGPTRLEVQRFIHSLNLPDSERAKIRSYFLGRVTPVI